MCTHSPAPCGQGLRCVYLSVYRCNPVFLQLDLDHVWLQGGGGGGGEGRGGGGERSVYVPQQPDRGLAELIYQALFMALNYSNPHSSWAVRGGCGRLGSQRN